MNPLRLWTISRRATRIGNLVKEASMTKGAWASKTLWFNLLTAGASLLQVLPVPPEQALLVTNAINIGLRLITSAPVSLTGK